MQETQVQSLGQEDPLEKEMATHSSCLGNHMDRDWWATVTKERGHHKRVGRNVVTKQHHMLIPTWKFLLACMLSHFSCVQLFATMWAPLSAGFTRQGLWSGLPCPPPGDLPDPGAEPESPTLQANSLLLSHWGSRIYLYPFIIRKKGK